MKTYSELKAKIKNVDNQDADDHRRAAEEARKQAANFRAIKAEAIINEDIAAYSDACRRVEFYEQRAAQEEKKAGSYVSVPVEEYVDAWEEYAKDYNKDMSKKLASFYKIRKEFASAWLEIAKTVAEGNAEVQQIREDLRGQRVGTMDIIETLTQLSRPEFCEARHGETPEIAITAKAFKLDENRRSNLQGIFNGWNTNGDIYAESYEEKVAKVSRNDPAQIFHYPVYLPETEEQERARKLRGNYNPPVGYVLSDGLSTTYKEDKDFYKRQEQKAREEALKTPVNND